VLLGGGGGFFYLKSDATPKPAVGQPTLPQTPPEPTKPERLQIKITSTPEGASVFRTDKGTTPIGVTPYTFEVDKGSGSFYVELKLAGYQSVSMPVKPDMNKEIPLTLQKEPEVAAPTPVKTSSSSSSSKPKSDKPKAKAPHDEMGLIPLEFK